MTTSTHLYRAYLLGTPDRELSIEGGTIRLDSTRSPHVTATLDVALGAWQEALTEYPDGSGFGFGEGPFGGGGFGGWYYLPEWVADPTILADLDPRENARIRIDVDAVTAYGALTRSFDLGLRDREIDYTAQSITLQLASDEGLLDDFAPLTDDTAPLALAGSLRDVIDYVLDVAIPGASLEASPANDADLTPAPGAAEDDAFTWQAGQSAMDFLHPLCQVAGYRLVCDEQRNWTLRAEDYYADGSITVRYAVNMIESDETISRDSGVWYDAAAVVHEWADSAGETQRRVDSYALTTPYTRLQLFEKDTPYPGPGFAEYAVRRAQGRGREVVAAAVSDWRAQAEQPVTIVYQDTPIQTGLTLNVEFSLDDDRMTINTRTVDTPDAAWLLIPEGETWLDQPLGESWTEEVI